METSAYAMSKDEWLRDGYRARRQVEGRIEWRVVPLHELLDEGNAKCNAYQRGQNVWPDPLICDGSVLPHDSRPGEILSDLMDSGKVPQFISAFYKRPVLDRCATSHDISWGLMADLVRQNRAAGWAVVSATVRRGETTTGNYSWLECDGWAIDGSWGRLLVTEAVLYRVIVAARNIVVTDSDFLLDLAAGREIALWERMGRLCRRISSCWRTSRGEEPATAADSDRDPFINVANALAFAAEGDAQAKALVHQLEVAKKATEDLKQRLGRADVDGQSMQWTVKRLKEEIDQLTAVNRSLSESALCKAVKDAEASVAAAVERAEWAALETEEAQRLQFVAEGRADDAQRHLRYYETLLRGNGIQFNPVTGHADAEEPGDEQQPIQLRPSGRQDRETGKAA